ncbi:MAG: tetratricopeptide repeat protein [Bacteroidia bacterium]|nr:tetratricopeptide repeat protein [Bacteroidia bacterium]
MSREEELRTRVELYPEDPFWPHTLGVYLLGQGRLAEAETAFLEALRRDPKYHATFYQLGLLYEQLGKEAEAIRYFREGEHLAEDARDLKLLHDFRRKLQLYLGLDET